MIYPEKEQLEEWMEDRIEEWHMCSADGENDVTIYEWLGWSWEEYATWVNGSTIPQRDIDLFVKLKDINAI